MWLKGAAGRLCCRNKGNRQGLQRLSSSADLLATSVKHYGLVRVRGVNILRACIFNIYPTDIGAACSHGGSQLGLSCGSYRLSGVRQASGEAHVDVPKVGSAVSLSRMYVRSFEKKAAADSLRDYLETVKDLKPKHAAFVSRNAPGFIRKLVVSVKNAHSYRNLLTERGGAESYSRDELFRGCVSAYLSTYGTDELEGLLESIGFDSGKIEETLSSTDIKLHGDHGLLAFVEELERLGFGMSKLWKLLEQDHALLSCSAADVRMRISSLKNLGVREDKIMCLVQKCPNVLLMNLEEVLKPMIQDLQEQGLDTHIVGSLLEYNPQRAICMNNSNLSNNIQFLRKLGFSSSQVSRTLKANPQLLVVSAEAELVPKILFLRNYGLDDDCIKCMVSSAPTFIGCRFEKHLVPKIKFLEGIGVSTTRVSSIFRRCPNILGLRIEETLLPKVQFLRDIGVDDGMIGKVIERCPNILISSIRENLQRKVLYLESIGADIKRIVERFPSLLNCSVEKNMVPKVELLMAFGVEKTKIGKVISACPTIFHRSLDLKLKPTLVFLQEMGLNGDKLGKLLVSKPSILTHAVDGSLADLIKVLQPLGFQAGSAAMAKAISTCFSLAATTITSRYQNLANLGFAKEDICEMVLRQPSIFCLKEEYIQEKLGYLSAEMGITMDEIVRVPVFLSYSLTQRIKPRHQVMQWLKLMGHLKRDYASRTILISSEKRFAEKFMQTHPEANAIFYGYQNPDPRKFEAVCSNQHSLASLTGAGQS